ncbi:MULTISPECIES: carbohydrate ABC transporter permease [Microbacterium]|uniref:carbohydrate ABC transporter permease n=1 Tax=Microbacterium TaxID=33882 RepID=UPI002781F14A|nr:MULTISPECIES: sugar ABC transporter permease [Microbacterium]MDQ1085005.1 ABC-type sugar transport system permease subunit [Microbacterium sp. SORGH_AS_0344]MDQ1169720.1 ABC-type sugar transport system permease subunit [Microbacterium proteolyticum]
MTTTAPAPERPRTMPGIRGAGDRRRSEEIRRRRSMHEKEGRAGYALIAPTTILLSVFYLYPLLQTVVYSFTDWNPGNPSNTQFVGFANFAGLFAENSTFPRALGNTALIAAIVVPGSMALGLVFAALLDGPFRGRSFYRTMIFAPHIAPTVGSALIFSYLLTPLGGLVNQALKPFGINPVPFLTTEPWAIISVIVFVIWQQVGYTMIIFSAALSTIPPSYHEAAKLDGAGVLRRFFSISLPLVAPTSGFLVITGLISTLQIFTQVFVLTAGGPLGSTKTVIYWVYEQGFQFFNGGAATAASVLLLAIGITVTVLQLRFLARRDTIEML